MIPQINPDDLAMRNFASKFAIRRKTLTMNGNRPSLRVRCSHTNEGRTDPITQQHVPKSGRFMMERYVNAEARAPCTIRTGGKGAVPSEGSLGGVRIEYNGTGPAPRNARTAVLKVRILILNE